MEETTRRGSEELPPSSVKHELDSIPKVRKGSLCFIRITSDFSEIISFSVPTEKRLAHLRCVNYGSTKI